MIVQRLNSSDPASRSLDLVRENIEQLKTLFPETVTEGKIDFERLRAILGDEVEDSEEYYRFTWAGKSAAQREVHKPATGTFRPVKEESVDWEKTGNLYIEGDNLEVLKLLQKSYAGTIKMIYIDPPYNTGKDFVYKDNYADNLRNYRKLTGQIDKQGNKTSTNNDTYGRYHSNWLNMMYPRLQLARNLLKEDGVIFLSIDDHEDFNLRKLVAEIFGEENYLATFIWNKQHSQQQGIIKKYHESVLLYAKNARLITNISGGDGEIDAGALKKISKVNPASPFTFPAGVRFEAKNGTKLSGTYGNAEKITVLEGTLEAENGVTKQRVTLSAGWTQKDQMTRFFKGEEVYDTKGQRIIEFYFNSAGKLKCRKERSKITPSTLLPKFGTVSKQTSRLQKLMGHALFDNPKPVEMIKNFVNWFCKESDVILDFFSGSGTTAHAVMQLNAEDGGSRKFIQVQLPEPTPANSEARSAGYATIADIGKERIRRAAKKIMEAHPDQAAELDLGFKVFKLDNALELQSRKAAEDP